MIWSDGAMLVPPLEGEPTFNGAFTTLGETDWYLQKDAENTWQAQTLNAAEARGRRGRSQQRRLGRQPGSEILEAGKQVRVETALYANLLNPKINAALGGESTMTGYTMEWTNPPTQGPEEMLGDRSVHLRKPGSPRLLGVCAADHPAAEDQSHRPGDLTAEMGPDDRRLDRR